MEATKAVREIMVSQKVKISSIADKLHIENANVITQRLRQKNISITKLDEMLRLMDYKIVLAPVETIEQEGWFRIE